MIGWPELKRALEAAPGWRRGGREYHGPCPDCGGTDRAWLRPGDTAAVVGGCRGCGKTGIALARALLGRDGASGGAALPAGGVERSTAPLRPPESSDTDLPARIWAGTCAADGSPAAAYLALRGVWPAGVPLPAVVRWLPADRAVGLRPPLPRGAAGCIAYLFAAPGEPAAAAVQVEALRANGERLAFAPAGKRPSVAGSTFKAGRRVLVARRGEPGGGVDLAEGPIDALALITLERLGALDLGGAAVVGAAGVGGFRAAAVGAWPGPVRIRAQDDGVSVLAAAKLASVLAAAGRDVEIRRPEDGLTGRDWADLANDVELERESLRDG